MNENDIAAPGCMDALVHRIRQTLVRFGYPAKAIVGLIAFKNLKGFIGRSAVDNEVLHAPEGLVFHRLQSRCNAAGIVQRGRDDGEKRPVRQARRIRQIAVSMGAATVGFG